MTDYEARLVAEGFRIVDDWWPDEALDRHHGFVGVWPEPETIRWVIALRPDTSSEDREMFAEWVWQRKERFLEHGPEPDGWQARSDGGWQLWTAKHYVPGF